MEPERVAAQVAFHEERVGLSPEHYTEPGFVHHARENAAPPRTGMEALEHFQAAVDKMLADFDAKVDSIAAEFREEWDHAVTSRSNGGASLDT
jgi:hypothetical protein